MPESTFATRLKALREQAGLSQSELSRLSGVGQNAISGYENGSRSPRLKNALALARALACDQTTLIYGSKAPTSPDTFATRLKQMREKAGLEQSELARLSGVSQNSISRYEAGQFEPKRQQLQALARALGCRVEELTG